jgi:hypothetical protein
MKKMAYKLAAVAAAAALVLTLAFTLTSCGGGLSGTYVSTGNAFDSAQFNSEPLVSVEFKSFGGAEIVTSGWSATTYQDGSYNVNGSRLTLKAEWNYTDEWEGSYSFRESGNSIYIDDHEYSK